MKLIKIIIKLKITERTKRCFMNRRKEPVSIRTEKKIQKEVKKGIRKASSTSARTSEELKTILKMHPKKKKAASKITEGSVSKTVARKQVYTHKKLSKRTSPEEKVDSSAPAYIHKENGRWAKTVRKQSVLRGKRLSKKLSHQTKRAAG